MVLAAQLGCAQLQEERGTGERQHRGNQSEEKEKQEIV